MRWTMNFETFLSMDLKGGIVALVLTAVAIGISIYVARQKRNAEIEARQKLEEELSRLMSKRLSDEAVSVNESIKLQREASKQWGMDN